MSVAKHILASQTQGPEAGLEMYVNTPISRRQAAYAEIMRKRTHESRLATYCRLFDLDKDGPVTTPVQADAKIDAIQALAEAFTDEQKAALVQLGLLDVDIPAAAPEVVEYTWETPHADAITAGEAWEALNGDGDFPKPQNPDKPATAGQLGRLNVLGLIGFIEA